MPGFNSKAKIIPPIDLRSAWDTEENPISEEEPLPEEKPISNDRTKLINIANKSSLSNSIPSKSPTSIEQRTNVQKSESAPKQYDLSVTQALFDHADTKALIRKYGPKLTEDMLDQYRDLLEKEQGGDEDAKQKRREFVNSLENS
jgi:hypothetical protein